MSAVVLQIFFAVFNFVLVLALLAKFAGPTVIKALNEKNEANRKAIEAAEAAQAKAAEELGSFKTRLANVEGELKAIVEQAKTLAAQNATSITETAKADAERLRAHATTEVERERVLAQQAIQRALMAQALEAARAELARQMNPELQRRLVARFIQNVEEGACAINP